MTNTHCRKAYVSVNLDVDEEGVCHPRFIRWENGLIFQIDQILYKCRAASKKVGGGGIRYEAQIAKLEEEIERYQKLKLRLYEDLSDGIIDKSEYFEFRNSYTKIIEEKQEALLRVKKEMKQSVTTGATERNWVTLFKQYENIEELNRRVLMALVDRILIYEDHAIEIVFKYKDEYQQTLEYVLGYADELAIAG